MTLFRGSRYRKVGVVQVQGASGDVDAVYKIRQTSLDIPVGSRSYTTKAEDTLESIAYREYGDGNKWYVIADVNIEIFWPLDLVAGMSIMIPPRSYAELA